MMVVEGCFDPITIGEVNKIKQLHKQYGKIGVLIKEDGVLSKEERQTLCKNALKPYRYVEVLNQYHETRKDITDTEGELHVRQGFLIEAAHGTHQLIFQKGYYFMEIAKAMCKPSRYDHSVRVGEAAYAIAKHHNVNPNVAYQVGLLHDITKAMEEEEARKLLTIYKPEWLSISPKVWHSYTAVWYAKRNLGLYDTKMLNAIEHHTLGDGNSKLARILYIADKIEPGRGYDTREHFQLAYIDLKACCQKIAEESAQYRKDREKQ